VISGSKVRPSIPLDAEGKHVGVLTVPHSRDESGWGAIRWPIAVIARGTGPSVLLTGANHGDELEGPIALTKLIRDLDPARVRGRIVVLPALNYPAFRAGRRTSPIDGGNMNRAFPGRADGTITQQMADWVYRALLPGMDAVLDIHSGGRTMEFLPFAAIHELADKAQQARAAAMLEAFAAPVGLVLRELDAEGMLDTAVESLGKPHLSTELGGGGSTTPATVAIAERGIRNVLRHLGILDGAPDRTGPVRWMACDDRSYLIADGDGLVEYAVELGAPVKAGDMVCRLHRVERPLDAPAEYRAGRDGALLGRCHGGLVQPGDFLALIAFDR
jgi:N-alpha-acetyl-L-2,4-diaminobutyrate deacetylase